MFRQRSSTVLDALSPSSAVSSDCEQIDADDYLQQMREKLGAVLSPSAKKSASNITERLEADNSDHGSGYQASQAIERIRQNFEEAIAPQQLKQKLGELQDTTSSHIDSQIAAIREAIEGLGTNEALIESQTFEQILTSSFQLIQNLIDQCIEKERTINHKDQKIDQLAEQIKTDK